VKRQLTRASFSRGFLKSEVWSLKSYGFTFIELVFVMVALAVLVVSAAPHLQRQWSRFQEEGVAFELAQELRTARTLAIAQSQPVTWMWEATTRQRWLAMVQDDGTVVPAPGRWGHHRVVPARVVLSITRDEQPAQQITFYPDGTSELTTLSVGIDSTFHYTITVYEATGQVALRATPVPA